MNTPRSPSDLLRSKAEKQLAARKAWAVPDGGVDQLKLIHELQVHQIELEMQNQVLNETFAHMDALRAKYQDLYEFAPMGYLTLSTDGNILELNGRAASLLGQNQHSLPGRALREFFNAASVAGLDKLLEDAKSHIHEVSAHSLELRRPRQLPVYVNAQAQAFTEPLGGETRIRLAMMDVSALKMATEDVIHAMKKATGPDQDPS
jgi:PAS domain S-box-containing protein